MRHFSSPTRAAPSDWRLDLRGAVVLVVADPDHGRHMLRQTTASTGAAVLTARDGREAMALVSQAVPDLVFLELVTRGIDGLDFLDYLRERKSLARIPVVAVTAAGADDDLYRTWDAGFNGHLVTPVTTEAMEAQLERVFWAHRHAQR